MPPPATERNDIRVSRRRARVEATTLLAERAIAPAAFARERVPRAIAIASDMPFTPQLTAVASATR